MNRPVAVPHPRRREERYRVPLNGTSVMLIDEPRPRVLGHPSAIRMPDDDRSGGRQIATISGFPRPGDREHSRATRPTELSGARVVPRYGGRSPGGGGLWRGVIGCCECQVCLGPYGPPRYVSGEGSCRGSDRDVRSVVVTRRAADLGLGWSGRWGVESAGQWALGAFGGFGDVGVGLFGRVVPVAVGL